MRAKPVKPTVQTHRPDGLHPKAIWLKDSAYPATKLGNVSEKVHL